MENKQSNISIDPETGKVDYGSYKNLIKLFTEFLIYYKNVFLKNKDVIDKNDPEFDEIFNNTKKQYNRFINHLAKYHKKEFNDIRSIIKTQIREISATGAGAAAGHFEPGSSMNTATPIKSTKYYYKLKGFKPVDTKTLNKENVEKETWINFIDDPKLKEKTKQEVEYYDEIQKKLNILVPLLKQAKTQTIQSFQDDPQSVYSPEYGTDIALKYLNDIITLFSKESRIK